jgi:hypothetical protein
MAIVPVDKCGEAGLILDIHPQELVPNAWSQVKNFVFREGFAERAYGHVAVNGTPLVEPWHLANFLSVNGNAWVYAGLQKIYGIDADLIHSNITRQSAGVDVDYSGDPNSKWNSTMLSGIVILNNGFDLPQFWPGTGKCADLTNWPTNVRCKVMRAFRNYLIALNVTKDGNNYPHLVKWSHVADPGTLPSSWDVTDTTKDAGEYDLADDQTELMDGLALGEQFIAYKRSGYYAVSFIGSPFIFRFQKISGLYGGALGTNCVTEFPGGHFVLGRGDVYVHQATAPESVIDARNRKWLFRQLDSDFQSRAFTMPSPAANELWICFPQVNDETCTLALVWNWKYNTWGVRELPGVVHGCAGSVNYSQPNTWETLQKGWQAGAVTWNQNISTLPSTNTVLASPTNVKTYAIELTSAFDGSPYEAYVSRDHIRFERPNTVKMLKEVRPIIEGPRGSTIQVYLTASYDQMTDPTVYGPYPFVIGIDQKIDCDVVGRMLGVKFSSTEEFAWRVKRYDLEIEEIGLY